MSTVAVSNMFFDEMNKYRAAKGLKPLRRHPKLDAIATEGAQKSARENTFYTTGNDGKSIFDNVYSAFSVLGVPTFDSSNDRIISLGLKSTDTSRLVVDTIASERLKRIGGDNSFKQYFLDDSIFDLAGIDAAINANKDEIYIQVILVED